jgi:hypothetical protein
MKTYFLQALLLGVMVSACNAPVNVQQAPGTDLASYHTYAWIDTKASETDNTQRTTPYQGSSFRDAANTELQKRGWREVTNETNADALVSYDILVQRKRERVNDPVYTQPFTRMYYNPYRRGWSTIYYPSQFVGYDSYSVPVREGTVTLTITDASTDKVVWQGWTTENLDARQISADEIGNSVRNIFRKFK